MRTYQGSGFPCRRGRKVCRWRVMPATGDPENLRTAAWDRIRHEKACPLPDDPATPQPREERPAQFRNIDDAATFHAARDVDDERDFALAARAAAVTRDGQAKSAHTPRRPVARRSVHSFNVRCKVCGKRFVAPGPRASYCADCPRPLKHRVKL